MTTEVGILTRAIAIVTAALPGFADWSDNSADPDESELPCFSVSLVRDGAVPAGMGTTLEEVQLTLEVEIFIKYRPAENGRLMAQENGEVVKSAVRGDPELQAMIDYMGGATNEVDLSKGQTRFARSTVALSLEATV